MKCVYCHREIDEWDFGWGLYENMDYFHMECREMLEEFMLPWVKIVEKDLGSNSS